MARPQLRPELRPPRANQQRLNELRADIERIADLIEQGKTVAATLAIADFNKQTGHQYTHYDFAAYSASRDLEEFALEAARPVWPKVADISRDELIELVRRVLAADPNTDWYLRVLETNLVHPRLTDLIFRPASGREQTPDAIVDEALSYRPIAL